MAPNPALEQILDHPRIWRGRRPFSSAIAAQPTGYPALDGLIGGWPQGAISELLPAATGIGEVQILLPAMARLSHSDRLVVWVAPPHLPYAPALARAGINLTRLLIVHTKNPEDWLWSMTMALHNSTTGLVLGWAAGLRPAQVRRLQLAAETARKPGILIRPIREREQPSTAALRLALSRPPESLSEKEPLQVELLKRRGGWGQGQCRLTLAPTPGDGYPG